MKIAFCGTLLSEDVSHTTIPLPEITPLGTIAGTVLGMAHAYSQDGATFEAAGDLVNALASYWYGFGWLHFGCAYGLLSLPGSPGTPHKSCPFQGSCDELPHHLGPKLYEKTTRYARLLDTARTSVVPAPDPATSVHEFAARLLVIVAAYATQGMYYSHGEQYEDALSCFSYGHGWLDAGVRAGLFQVIGNRDVFTI